MDNRYVIPDVTLTVVIADNSPFIHMQEPVRKRTVHIPLEQGQLDLLRLAWTGKSGGKDHYEGISDCWLEDK